MANAWESLLLFQRFPGMVVIPLYTLWMISNILEDANCVGPSPAQQRQTRASNSTAGLLPLNPARPKTRGKEAIFPPNRKADLILGGLFPMHDNVNTIFGQSCGSRLNGERGIHRLEAMLYAVGEVNKNPTLLPNITLGVLAHDTCSQDTIALEESLEFIMVTLPNRNPIKCDGSDNNKNSTQSRLIAGVVGAASSTVSIQVANLLRLFKIPQISYASTSPDLSNKHKYDYFVRTVPSDTHQARAMLDVIKALNWSAVFTVNSQGNYGERGMEVFLSLAKAANICVVSSARIESDSIIEVENIINNFRKEASTRGIVLFCTDGDVRKLLNATERAGAVGRFIWVASDYWGTRRQPIEYLEDAAEGAITISLRWVKHAGFSDYFTSLNPLVHSKIDPWFKEYWEDHFNCKLEGNFSSCPANASQGIYLDDKVPYVIDAVNAFARALHQLYSIKCPDMKGLCAAITTHNIGEELMWILRNISFQGITGEVHFNSERDPSGRYDIFRLLNGKYERVASWEKGLHLLGSKLYANVTSMHSNCGVPCIKGFYRSLKQDRSCCWTCKSCQRDEYVQDSTTCERCLSGETPNKDRTGCGELPLRYLADSWTVLITCFAACGIVCTFGVSVVFIMFNDTPLVKASGRELTFTLLVGLLLCYTEGILLVLHPTTSICGLQRFGVGFCSCVCYSALLIKTNRIARIFAKSERSTKPPDFINPGSQLFILTVIVGIEVVLAGVGLGYWLPELTRMYPTKDDVLLTCNIQNYDLVVAISYNVLLILLCTFYAFRTRKTPANFNEARYIGFAMYTTCVIWLAFLPVQFGVNDKDFKALTLSINTTLNATTLLLCVFGPKVYIVLFRPTRNVRSRSLTAWRAESDTQTTPAGRVKFDQSETPKQVEIGFDNPVHKQNGFVSNCDGDRVSTYL